MTPHMHDGRCDCGFVTFALTREPLVVHCCHCSWCQRESGAAFALNAMIESSALVQLTGEVMMVNTPSASGKGQQIARCPHCFVALWSHYAGSGYLTSFVRVGVLNHPDALAPDVHIFTQQKQPWLNLSNQAHVYPEYYQRENVWSESALARWQALAPELAAYKAAQA